MSFIAGYILGLEEGGGPSGGGIIDDIMGLTLYASGTIVQGWRYELRGGAMPRESPWTLMGTYDGAKVMTEDLPLRLWAVILRGDTVADALCIGTYGSVSAAVWHRQMHYSGGQLWWRDIYDLDSLTASVTLYNIGVGSTSFTLSADITVRMHHIRYIDYTHTSTAVDEITTWTGSASGAFPSSSSGVHYTALSRTGYTAAMEELGTAVM
ncbi:MAG: hypothetical protein IKR73_06610 [Oscillospiraceae bacterium]|nr:hypothetical protein [Oscillospiraceae bacterium]